MPTRYPDTSPVRRPVRVMTNDRVGAPIAAPRTTDGAG